MPERATVNQIQQIGVETTSGTAVAATKKLAAMQIDMGPRVDISTFRPMGNKFSTVAALNREWAEGSVSGPITYTEIVYALSSVIKTVTPTGTTAKTWTFAPSESSTDTKKTYTLETGSSVRAQEYPYTLFTGLGMRFDRSGAELNGSVIGQAMSDGITLTGSLSYIDLVPVMPTEVSVYLDSSGANLGNTALNRVMSAEWNIGDRYGPVWVLNADSSFAADVDLEPALELKLLVEADSAGMGPLADMRTGTKQFVRIEAQNNTQIEAGVYYTLTIDTCGLITDVSDFSDEDGVYAIEYTLRGTYDDTWGYATQVTVINDVASL